MSEEPRRIRPSIRDAFTNWNESDLPAARRFFVAMRNYSRRFGIPPKNCCGNIGEPGC